MTHHVGLENEARWCDVDAQPVCWTAGEDGVLSLGTRSRSVTRTVTRSVVGDTTGRIGYGPYVSALLRGMFDTWTLICRHRDDLLGQVERDGADGYARVVRRATSIYVGALNGDPVDPAVVFDAAESGNSSTAATCRTSSDRSWAARCAAWTRRSQLFSRGRCRIRSRCHR
ncbi:hypothetical protein [Fodinicola feengrottensis]|uniref:hypothetical protein n=1 Tax=Fodinicola feengrottensis TaxID=435914 RepID=UPI0024418016|nr:hypothetical protein [Fodinicola feengrottensis]